MSAYIVDKKTIDRIVTYLKKQCATHARRMREEYPAIWAAWKANGVNKLGQDLWEMNVQAVNQRYDENNSADLYHYEHCPEGKIQVYKSLQCYLYQCAEGDVPTWPLYKDLDRLADQLAREIVADLPEYDRAEWG